MRWRERPEQAAQRECEEETGLTFLPGDPIGYQSLMSKRFSKMSTLTIIFEGRISGGSLRPSIEGAPCWLYESELRPRLGSNYISILNDYLRYRSTMTMQSSSGEA
jgi:8-oxo-dGTP pyrophosphatase MutT (NUDIX family)